MSDILKTVLTDKDARTEESMRDIAEMVPNGEPWG